MPHATSTYVLSGLILLGNIHTTTKYRYFKAFWKLPYVPGARMVIFLAQKRFFKIQLPPNWLEILSMTKKRRL